MADVSALLTPDSNGDCVYLKDEIILDLIGIFNYTIT